MQLIHANKNLFKSTELSVKQDSLKCETDIEIDKSRIENLETETCGFKKEIQNSNCGIINQWGRPSSILQ